VAAVNVPGLSVVYNAANNQQTTDCADYNGNIMGNASCAGANAYTYDLENGLVGVPGGMQYGYSPANLASNDRRKLYSPVGPRWREIPSGQQG
jgi:hypothetical protein